MHTQAVLHKFFRTSFPDVHAARLDALTAAVGAVTHGASVTITTMGRGLSSPTRIKHRIKRMNRLVGNGLLLAERDSFYRVMSHRLLIGSQQPIILIDWSEFTPDGAQQLLRASLPVGGRAITLYEELHPQAFLNNRTVQHRFLDRLQAMLPSGCTPIIIADAGFKVPFFRYVQTLGWHWLGRIRGRDFVRWEGAPYQWVSAQSLFALATTRAQELGGAEWVRSNPLAARLVLIGHRHKGRTDRIAGAAASRAHRSRRNARRAREPWLLVASLSLQAYCAKRIVGLYKTRMQCEENFRDTKSTAYGLGIAKHCRSSFQRATNLLLIAALAHFLLWLIGCLARARQWDRAVRVTSVACPNAYSNIFLARLVIRHLSNRLPRDCLDEADNLVSAYLKSVT